MSSWGTRGSRAVVMGLQEFGPHAVPCLLRQPARQWSLPVVLEGVLVLPVYQAILGFSLAVACAEGAHP